MKANISQISAITGFSQSTVSKALNRKKGVNAQTAQIIYEAAEQLGYRSEEKITHVTLVSFRRHGNIIDDNIYRHTIMSGVEKRARELGLSTVFVQLDRSEPDFAERVHALISDPTTALLLIATEMQEDDFHYFEDAQNPLVIMDGYSRSLPCPSITFNNEETAESSVNYLVEHGHTKIGYIRGESRIVGFCEREDGYRNGMRKNGLAVHPDYIVTVGTSIETSYHKMLEHLQGHPELPTAFFADNDYIAIGSIRALQKEGYRIPEDISIIAMDNIEYSKFENPPLTTHDIHMDAMGEIAVNTIISSEQTLPRAKTKILICTDFVERKSVRDLRGV